MILVHVEVGKNINIVMVDKKGNLFNLTIEQISSHFSIENDEGGFFMDRIEMKQELDRMMIRVNEFRGSL